LTDEGKLRNEWEPEHAGAESYEKRFAKEKPRESVRLAACLHVTTDNASVMQMLKAGGADAILRASDTLSTQNDVKTSLPAEFILVNTEELGNSVYAVPAEVDKGIARLKLNAMGIKIDKLTPEQQKYLSS
jgi:S-adenosylhomocysteine hydrolase